MNIHKINFLKLFNEQKKLSSSKIIPSSAWDSKAAYMNKRVKHSIYNKAFISNMNFEDSNTLLDFGCGTGNISIPIANKFTNIYAIDYSKGMIDTYLNNAKEDNLSNVSAYVKTMDEDWEGIPKCDIVIASRSINGTNDIEDALVKLNSYAKKRVYLTFKTCFSFFDKKLYDAIGQDKTPAPDYIYIINILYSLGIHACVDFIPAETKYQSGITFDKFLDMVIWELGKLGEDELAKLKIYFDKEVKNKEDKHAYWALISWENIQRA